MNSIQRKTTYDVFVGNLPSTADEPGMRNLFGQYGEINSVVLKEGKQPGTQFGFVRFNDEECAQKAISDASGKYVNGKVLLCKRAERNTNKSSNSYSSNPNRFGGSAGGDSAAGGDAKKTTGFGSARTRGIAQQNSDQAGAPSSHQTGLHSSHQATPPNAQVPTAVGEETVMLTHAANACCVYVQIGKEEAIKESSKLMADMQGYCQTATPLSSKPEPNKLYGAVFSEDGMWYRCKVLALGQNPKEARVRYVDYGNEEITDASKMVNLSNELNSIKLQAYRLNMIDLKPASTAVTNSEEHKRAVNFLMGVADGKFLKVRLYKALTSSDEGTPAELACEGQNLNRLMRDHGFAVPVTPAASPNRGPDPSQNGVGGQHVAQPRQQRQVAPQQNRQQQPQGQQNRQGQEGQQNRQGQMSQQQNRQQAQGGGNRGPVNRNDGQLENAQREIKSLKESAKREITALKGDIDKLDKSLLGLKSENDTIKAQFQVAVQEKFTKLQRSFDRVRTLRKEMPLEVADKGVIETAINLLGNTETSIRKKVLDAQAVMAANDHLESCQEELRKCSTKESLPDLMVSRNEARQQTFQSITSFLANTKSLPLVDRQEQVKSSTHHGLLSLTSYSEDVSIALECLEAKHFDLLVGQNTTPSPELDEGQVSKVVTESIEEYEQWKGDMNSFLNKIRGRTDQHLLLWTSLLAKLLLGFSMEREEDVEEVQSTDELIEKLLVVMETELFITQKDYVPIVTLDPSLLDTKIEKQNIKNEVLTKTVCCLTKELRRELASIDTLVELYNHHEALSKELEPWMNAKPDVTDMQAVQRDVKGLRSRLRHKLADKHDMDEAPELCEEVNQDSLDKELATIRTELQSVYAKGDKLLVGLAELTKRHFPELALLHPSFQIKDYIESNGLLKKGRDLQQFDLQPLTGTKNSMVKSGKFNGNDVIIKSYNISSDETRNTLLHNAIAYSKLNLDRLLHIQAVIPTTELANQLHVQLPRIPMNLCTAVKETTLSRSQLQTIFVDIVTGLNALHEQGVIHGAVHPENVLVTEDKCGILAEYDFSKTPTERAQQGYKTDNGLHFTAPEINCGLDAHVASDMFAFGVLLLWAHFHETTFSTLPDGTPDLTKITIEERLGDIIRPLVNYSQGKRPHAETVASSAYFTVRIEPEEEKEEQKEENVEEEKEEEEEGKEEQDKDAEDKDVTEEEKVVEEQVVEVEEENKSDEKETEDAVPEDDGPPALEHEDTTEDTTEDTPQNTEGGEEIKRTSSPTPLEETTQVGTKTSPIGRIQSMIASKLRSDSP